MAKYLVLKSKNKGREKTLYWTGEETKHSHQAAMSGKIEEAKLFDTAREAYDAAADYIRLADARVIRHNWPKTLDDDGFIHNWWNSYYTYDAELFDGVIVSNSPSKGDCIDYGENLPGHKTGETWRRW